MAYYDNIRNGIRKGIGVFSLGLSLAGSADFKYDLYGRDLREAVAENTGLNYHRPLHESLNYGPGKKSETYFNKGYLFGIKGSGKLSSGSNGYKVVSVSTGEYGEKKPDDHVIDL